MSLMLAGGAPGHASGDQQACCEGAEHMIEVGRQALANPSSRPERTAKRRKLVEDWEGRLRGGEDPCTVYADIYKASKHF